MNKKGKNTKQDDVVLQMAIAEFPDDLTLKFLLAAATMNYKVVKQCLDLGVNSNIIFEDQTALHLAAENGNIQLLHILLTYPETKLNVTDLDGLTPLNIASKNGFSDLVIHLLKYNADINLSDRFKMTPLHNAVKYGHLQVVGTLLENGANPNLMNTFGHTPLFIAANETVDINIVEKLIQHKADPNLYDKKFTMTLLMECCLGCDTPQKLEVINFLLRRGVMINDVYPMTMRTALHIAAFKGNAHLVKLLLKNGARTDMKDIRGKMPFQIAKEQRNKIVERILRPNVIVMCKINNSAKLSTNK